MNVFRSVSARGFTLVEVLIVAAVFAIIAALSIVTLSESNKRQQFQTDVSAVTRALIEQQADTLGADSSIVHGVQFDSQSVTAFEGDTYSTGAASNETATMTVSTISTNLSGAASAVWFASLTGAPSATGTVLVTNSEINRTATITIYASGLIE